MDCNSFSQKNIFAFIRETVGQGNVLTCPRLFLKLLDGDSDAGLFLSQLIYWTDKTSDGWIYKTYSDWYSELYMKEKKVRAIKDKLEKLGLIETAVKKVNGSPTVHYRVDPARLVEWIRLNEEDGNSSEGGNDTPQMAVSSITKITSKITTKTISNTVSAKKPKPDYSQDFESFWEAYPQSRNKNSKPSASKEYQALRTRGETHEQIMATLSAYSLECKGLTDSKYIRCPHNWLKDYTRAEPPKNAEPTVSPSMLWGIYIRKQVELRESGESYDEAAIDLEMDGSPDELNKAREMYAKTGKWR